MLGMGWQEIFLVAVIAVIVVGPKELPRVFAHRILLDSKAARHGARIPKRRRRRHQGN